MECLGGNGYVEEAPLARLYREAPLNGIWEGSGNVICLDVLRSIEREPDSVAALLAEIGRGGERSNAQGVRQRRAAGAAHCRGHLSRAPGESHGAASPAGSRRCFLRLAAG